MTSETPRVQVHVRDEAGEFLPAGRIILRINAAKQECSEVFATWPQQVLVSHELYVRLRAEMSIHFATPAAFGGRLQFMGMAIVPGLLDADMVLA